MNFEVINRPERDQLLRQLGYSEISRVGSMLYASGTLGGDENGNIPEGYAEQLRNCLRHLEKVLTIAGSDLSKVAHITYYVVVGRDSRSLQDIFGEIMPISKEMFADHCPPSTAVGVAELGRPAYLIEAQAIALSTV